jgi:CysZ protein
MQSFRGTLFFLAAAPGVLLLGLIPLVGPPLAILWGAFALAFQQTDAALARRGLAFADRRAWHRYWNLESLGFGVTGLVTLIVPFANILVIPALTVGGTLLVLELEDQLIPADVPPRSAR